MKFTKAMQFELEEEMDRNKAKFEAWNLFLDLFTFNWF